MLLFDYVSGRNRFSLVMRGTLYDLDYYDYMDYIKEAVGIKYKDGTIRVITVYEKAIQVLQGHYYCKISKQENRAVIRISDIERLERS